MGNALKRETFLPDMTAAVVVSVIAAYVRRHQPLHPAAQIAVFIRPQQQMKVIGHQTVADQPHRDPLMSLDRKINKGEEVSRFVEHVIASVTPV